MKSLLAFDPGDKAGWAWFGVAGLYSAGAFNWADWNRLTWAWCPLNIVIECPCYRPNSRVNPNDLITLARKVGQIEERFAGIPIEIVFPHAWKGSVKKSIHNRRVLRKLTEAERDRLPKNARGNLDHNMIDAVGLGLWTLGRMGRGA